MKQVFQCFCPVCSYMTPAMNTSEQANNLLDEHLRIVHNVEPDADTDDDDDDT